MKTPLAPLLAAALLLASCASPSMPAPPACDPATSALMDAAMGGKPVKGARATLHRLLVDKIMSLPPFLVHEEDVADFRKRLEKGRFTVRNFETIALDIDGDGAFGARRFEYNPYCHDKACYQHLEIFMHEWETEPADWGVYHYLPAEGRLERVRDSEYRGNGGEPEPWSS